MHVTAVLCKLGNEWISHAGMVSIHVYHAPKTCSWQAHALCEWNGNIMSAEDFRVYTIKIQKLVSRQNMDVAIAIQDYKTDDLAIIHRIRSSYCSHFAA